MKVAWNTFWFGRADGEVFASFDLAAPWGSPRGGVPPGRLRGCRFLGLCVGLWFSPSNRNFVVSRGAGSGARGDGGSACSGARPARRARAAPALRPLEIGVERIFFRSLIKLVKASQRVLCRKTCLHRSVWSIPCTARGALAKNYWKTPTACGAPVGLPGWVKDRRKGGMAQDSRGFNSFLKSKRRR